MTSTNSLPSNLAVAESFFAALAQGDIDSLRKAVSLDIEWTVVGHTHPIARTYRGQDQMFGDLLGTLMTLFVPGSTQIEVLSRYEDAARSTVITHFREQAVGQAANRDFDNQIVTIMTITDGVIVRALEFMDLYELKLSTEA